MIASSIDTMSSHLNESCNHSDKTLTRWSKLDVGILPKTNYSGAKGTLPVGTTGVALELAKTTLRTMFSCFFFEKNDCGIGSVEFEKLYLRLVPPECRFNSRSGTSISHQFKLSFPNGPLYANGVFRGVRFQTDDEHTRKRCNSGISCEMQWRNYEDQISTSLHQIVQAGNVTVKLEDKSKPNSCENVSFSGDQLPLKIPISSADSMSSPGHQNPFRPECISSNSGINSAPNRSPPKLYENLNQNFVCHEMIHQPGEYLFRYLIPYWNVEIGSFEVVEEPDEYQIYQLLLKFVFYVNPTRDNVVEGRRLMANNQLIVIRLSSTMDTKSLRECQTNSTWNSLCFVGEDFSFVLRIPEIQQNDRIKALLKEKKLFRIFKVTQLQLEELLQNNLATDEVNVDHRERMHAMLRESLEENEILKEQVVEARKIRQRLIIELNGLNDDNKKHQAEEEIATRRMEASIHSQQQMKNVAAALETKMAEDEKQRPKKVKRKSNAVDDKQYDEDDYPEKRIRGPRRIAVKAKIDAGALKTRRKLCEEWFDKNSPTVNTCFECEKLFDVNEVFDDGVNNCVCCGSCSCWVCIVCSWLPSSTDLKRTKFICKVCCGE